MIEFKWSKVDKKNQNTPVIKDVEIDELAEELLQDYKPRLLKEPGKIKYEHFLESYLGVVLDYQHIYYEENTGRILGATAFNREELLVFDKDNKCIDKNIIEKNTIILDFYVTEEGREGLERFTGLHEAGHFWMHQGVYVRNDMQMSLFENDGLRPITCCRKADIESFGRRRSYRTPEQWREHQADYFASALAMPNATFIPVVQEVLRPYGITDGRVIEDAGHDEYSLARKMLPAILADLYGVSRTAAYVKLKKLGLVVDQNTVDLERQQLQILN